MSTRLHRHVAKRYDDALPPAYVSHEISVERNHCTRYNMELAGRFQQLVKSNMKQLASFGMKCPMMMVIVESCFIDEIEYT